MIAFHNDPNLRRQVLKQIAAHAKADQIIQGSYWSDGRGCAVGCLTHDPQGGHHLYSKLWGIPEVLARLEDRIFEGLPVHHAKRWPARFLGAIRTGANLELVWPEFAHTLLLDPTHGCLRYTLVGSTQRHAVESVAELLQRRIRGIPPTHEDWETARRGAAAAYAASYAAYAASYASYAAASDADAAYAASYAAFASYAAAAASASYAAYAASYASYAAASAADAAYAASYADAARTKAYEWQAEVLVTLLAAAP